MIDAAVKLRIDKWLWAARFFKTRSLAVDAIENGRVMLDGLRVKPAKTLSVGDRLDLRIDQQRIEIEVLMLSDKRSSASIAKERYRESDESIARRALIAEQRQLQPEFTALRGRPTKRCRRDIEKFKYGS